MLLGGQEITGNPHGPFAIAFRPMATSGRRAGLAALAVYSVLAFLFWGLGPLLEPGRQYVGVFDDPQIPIWSFGWWLHAIEHGSNPLYTHEVWAPSGVDLAWVNTIPPIAVLFAPAHCAPRPGCVVRHRRGPPPGRLGLGGLPPLPPPHRPVLALPRRRLPVRLLELHARPRPRPAAADRRLRDAARRARPRPCDRGKPRPVGRSCCGSPLSSRVQLYLSLEVALTLTLVLGLALVVGFLLAPPWRRPLVHLLVPLAIAYGVAAVLAAPILYYALTSLRVAGFTPPAAYTADLLNFFLPTHLEAVGAGWAGSLARHWSGNSTEQGAFVGIPLLLIVVFYVRSSWRTLARPVPRRHARAHGVPVARPAAPRRRPQRRPPPDGARARDRHAARDRPEVPAALRQHPPRPLPRLRLARRAP